MPDETNTNEAAPGTRDERLVRGAREAAHRAAPSGEPTEAFTPPYRPHVEIVGYEMIRELHRGGQGVVYQAIQKATKRKVAIKVLLEGPFASASTKKRFEREVGMVAQLKHPHIVTIFDSGITPSSFQGKGQGEGREAGIPWFAMDYVRGVPLRDYVRDNQLTLEQTLKLFGQVCEAVQYAHQKGVIHRDLKPSNILVDSDGAPKVLDFGLAKQAGPVETVVSMTGQVVGTLPYMSPEQARGNPDHIDTRTDVYALGVILYELLTGHYPYPVVGQLDEVLRHIKDTPPTPPSRAWKSDSGVTARSERKLRPGQCPIDDDVQTIVLKALAKERERRYQGAGDLARDLARYLAGDAIEARRDSGLYVLRKLVARHRRRVVTVGAIVALMTVAAYFAEAAWRWSERARSAELRKLVSDAQSCFDQGGYAEAVQHASKVLCAAPENLEAALVHGRALLALARYQEAEAALSAALRRHPAEAAPRFLLAEVLAASDPPRSASFREQAQRLARDDPRDYYLRALSAGDDRQAIDLLTTTLDREPQYFDALMARTTRYFRTGDFSQMRVDAECARVLRPMDPRAWYNVGTARLKLDDWSGAVSALQRAVSLKPAMASATMASAWFNLGFALEQLHDLPAAERAYEASTASDFARMKPWFALARVRIALHELESALLAIERALAVPDVVVSDRRELLLQAAQLQERLDRPQRALEIYLQASELDPNDWRAPNNAAWLLLTPAHPPAELGIEHAGLERSVNRALALAKSAVAVNPDQPEALGTLALAELRSRDYRAAFEHSSRALDTAPSEGDRVWDLLVCGWSALENGMSDVARERWRTARQLMHDHPARHDAALSRFAGEVEQRFSEIEEAQR